MKSTCLPKVKSDGSRCKVPSPAGLISGPGFDCSIPRCFIYLGVKSFFWSDAMAQWVRSSPEMLASPIGAGLAPATPLLIPVSADVLRQQWGDDLGMWVPLPTQETPVYTPYLILSWSFTGC